VSFGRVVRAVLPYVAALIVALVIVAYSEAIVLWVPRLYGYSG
jgi:TRAP-type C4-dicarboxylate transport system permease large subunit